MNNDSDRIYINGASERNKAEGKAKKKSIPVRRLRVTFYSQDGYNQLLADDKELLKLSFRSRLQERPHATSPYIVDLFYEKDWTSDLLKWEKKYPESPKKVETYSGSSPKLPDMTNFFTKKIQETREAHMNEMSFPSLEDIDGFIKTLETLKDLANAMPVNLDLKKQWQGQLTKLMRSQNKLKKDATQFHM